MKTFKANLSHVHEFSCDMGQIIPFANVEILPGDVAEISVDGLIKFSPMVAPLLHRIKATFVWTFVPTKLVDSGFTDFITGGVDGNDSTTLPTISTGTAAKGTVYDYLGVPIVNNLSFLAHYVRAYNSFYNNYVRDVDLQQTEVSEDSTDIQYIMWQKDYFTSARPSEQKGTAVTIPIGTTADVDSTGTPPTFDSAAHNERNLQFMNAKKYPEFSGGTPTADQAMYFGDVTGLQTDLTSATGVTPNDLKEAWAFQNFMERSYKTGSRYSEYVKHLGGYDGDRSLQEPEIVGVSSADITMSEVLQTSPDSGTSTVTGHQTGQAGAGIRGRRAFKYFGEHGILLGLMYIRPEAIYTNGLHRKFSRTDKEDYYQPEFANIGWQPILNKEIYAQGTGGGSDDGNTFAYCPRYDEYRSEPSRVSADFRDTLDTRHLARQLSSLPTFNQAFVSTSGTIRNADIFASTASDTIYCVVNNRIKMRRIVTPREMMTFRRF
jgi:hypothetical protein